MGPQLIWPDTVIALHVAFDEILDSISSYHTEH